MFAIHPATSLRLSYENPIRRSIAGATEAARVHQSLQQKRPIAIAQFPVDRKSTRLNSSHVAISYAVFCLKKKKKTETTVRNGSRERGVQHSLPARSGD